MNINRHQNFFPLEMDFENKEFYLFSSLFVFGNLALPWFFHMIPQGGLMFLPIYFFVLIGAYKFGWKVGLATAVLSPLANHLLTGMPPEIMLPSILVKGTAMAFLAAFVASKTHKLTLANLAVVVIGYQLVGSLFQAAYMGSVAKAISEVTLGVPGMLLQLVGGYFILSAIGKYRA